MTTEEAAAPEKKASFLNRPVGGGKKAEPKPKQGKLGIPTLPQVNLMPPEVLGGRKVAALKRKLVWLVILTLVICLVAYAGAFFLKMQADSRQEEALADADHLNGELKKYSPVSVVLSDIKNEQDARAFALASEVNWTNYVYQIQTVLPESVTINTINVQGTPAGSDLQAGADELTRDGIAVISFSAFSETLPDASEWIDALESVPGLADAHLQSSTLEDESGELLYQVSATVQVTEAALANRTFPDQEPLADDEAATEGED